MTLLRLLTFMLLLPGSVGAAELFGTIEDLHGAAYVTEISGQTFPLAIGQKIYEGSTLGTQGDAEVHLTTVDGNFIALRPNSQLKVDAYKAHRSSDDKIHLSLIKGALRSITGWIAKLRKDSYQIRTATVTIGVRGTDHETIELDTMMMGSQPGTYERVIDGTTFVRSRQGEIEVRAGDTAFAPRDRADAPRVLPEPPQFIKERSLRLEQKIAQRKENLNRPIEAQREGREVREEREAAREEHAREIREKISDLPPEQRERFRESFHDASPAQRDRMERRVIRRMRDRD